MKYPGDLLHEAGHLAVLLPQDRAVAQNPDKIFGDLDRDGAEMAAIAWSWAALTHLEIDPGIVFHEHGYKGAAANLVENFSNGKYIGAPMPQWLGMTTGNAADDNGGARYPEMKYWLRQG